MIEVCGFALYPSDAERSEPGPTPSEEEAIGTATLYRIAGPDALELELGDIAWDNGERSVTILDRLDSPTRFDGLVRRLRMSVQPIDEDESVIELSAARFKRPDRPSLVKVDIPTLSAEIGVDITNTLGSVGARAVGTKEAVLKAQDNRKSYWCAAFADEHAHVPVTAFLLLRVVPVHLKLT